MKMVPSPVVRTYPLSNYSFDYKASKIRVKYASLFDRLQHIQTIYMKEGRRTTVEGVLLVQVHNHPHILLLKLGSTLYKLPGGRIKPGESDIEGLKRKLCNKLASVSPSLHPDWQIGECVGMWWRPQFQGIVYPYCPPHITKPTECDKLFVVQLPEQAYFVVPNDMTLIAVPFYDLYDNVQKYGTVISSIPQLLSRFHLDNDPSTNSPV